MKRDGDSLEQIGIMLFGQDWQQPMADALGVNDRLIRRGRADQELPEGIWQDLGRLMRQRAQELQLGADTIDAGGVQRQVGEMRAPPRR